MTQSGYAVVRRPVQWWLALVLMTFMQSLLAQPAPKAATAVKTKTVLVMGDSLSAGYGLGPTEGWVPLTATKVSKEKLGWKVVNASISGVSLLAQPAPKAATAVKTKTVLVMGDSLSAGYGLGPTEGWVPLTATKVSKEKPGWKVVNASISGETSAGGAARIDAQLQRLKPAVVVIELGANDGLRGLPLAQTKTNLEKMITASQKTGAKVLLLGMQMPPNLGRAYTDGFAGNFSALAKQYNTAFIPFFLQPIVSERANFQPDNLHPIAAVQPTIRDFVWPALAPLLK